MEQSERNDRLYLRALSIRYSGAVGYWLPIIWHLALRGHTGAMIELADWLSADDSQRNMGKPADAFSAAGLYRRAWQRGDARGASNMAVSCFNRNDLAGYRQWLGCAAKAGDDGARTQRRCFETRLSHGAARKIRRLRKMQARDKVF